MYPRNAASPERIAIGAVVQISDGAVQTSGVSIKVKPQGTAASTGGGTTSYEEGIVEYLPTQAETNYTSFEVIAYKTGCIPVAVTIVTTASATPGTVLLAPVTHTSAVVPTVTTLTGHTPQTGDAFARLGAPAGASVSVDIAAVKTQTAAIEVDTQDIQSRLPAALVSGRIDASVGAMASAVLTATAIAADAIGASELAADAVAEIQSGLATAASLATVAGYVDTEIAAMKVVLDRYATMIEITSGSPGDYQFTVDALRNAPSGTGGGGGGGSGLDAAGVRAAIGLASANLDTQLASIKTDTGTTIPAALVVIDDFLDTEIAAIKAKTDNLPAAPAAASDIPSAAAIADAVWDEATSGHVSAGSTGLALGNTDLRGSRTVIRGTSASGASTTSLTPSALSPAGSAADQFKGRILVFDNDTATAALRGQATDITASSAASLAVLTFTALTTAPASGDTFSIL